MQVADLLEASQFEKQEFLKLAKEAANRTCEALRIYNPLPFQQAFHECRAKECLIMKGNRAGGSLAGFAEDARAVTGQDPYGKYPLKDGICVCLGFGEKHIGRVIHKFLFRAGGFRIIRDLETREWRVFRPWDAENGGDQDREAEARPAPPLIPPRYIEDMVWEKRGERVFSVCRLVTGWEIYALNSAGDPSQAQGFDVNLYHIDEDTANIGWYEEAVGRVAMTQGLIRWTALPHSKNDDILNMVQRAEDEAGQEKPLTVCIRASMFDNPYYPKESRDANLKIWAAQGEDVVRKRAYGEMVVDSVLMYPTFSKWVHTTVPRDEERSWDIQKRLAEWDGEPPANWCLDMVVDPGHTICAVLLIATCPPELGEFHIVFKELYLQQCDAEKFGSSVEKLIRNRQYERFIIDAHGGRLTDIGSGITPQRQYENQLKQRGLKCNATGSYFENGSDDVRGREMTLREWFRARPIEGPTVFINVQECPNLVRELERFKKKTKKLGSQVVILDDGNRGGGSHAVECLEYASAHGLRYVKPRASLSHSSWVQWVIRDRNRREEKRRVSNPEGVSKPTISLAPRGEA